MKMMYWKRTGSAALLMLLAMYAAGSAWVYRAMETAAPPPPDAGSTPGAPVELTFTDAGPWARPGLEKIAAQVERYQLAGTFQTFTYSEEREETLETALALVDDLESGRQQVVRDGDELGPFTVTDITRDTLRLTHGERAWTLQLSGRLPEESATLATGGETGRNRRFEKLPALEVTRFGKRVAENQWVLDRDKVKDYAYDIANSPLRAASLYRSFNQVSGEEGQEEAGFRLRMKGERDFFAQMGLTDEDVIRKVNSMKMKNTARAEYLIGEFMQDRMGLVVLDIERNGEARKLLYILRD